MPKLRMDSLLNRITALRKTSAYYKKEMENWRGFAGKVLAEKLLLEQKLGVGEQWPWPPKDALRQLVKAVEHLLNDHDCDCHGYEETMEALNVAKLWLKEI